MCTLRLYSRILFVALLLHAGQGLARAAELTVVGTGDGLDILRAVAAAYGARHPGTSVQMPPSIGSGGAIAAVGSNREKLGRIARALTANELASGIRYHPVFDIPAVFFVHPEIPVRDLPAAKLQAIFAGEITSWREVGGPETRIRVVRREEADSSVLVFRAAIPEFQNIKFTERSKLALTTQEAISSILENPGAIGFGSYSTAVARQLGVVSINGLAPTHPGYPANTALALIYKPDQLDDEMRRFLAFFNSDEARKLITDFGARPSGQ